MINNLPLETIQGYETYGYYFTDRFWPNKGEAVLDSFLNNLILNPKTRSISLQSLQAKLESPGQDTFYLLKNFIQYFEEYLENPTDQSLQDLSDKTKDTNYIDHIQRLNLKFDSIENISEELNIRITVYSSLGVHETASNEKFFCPMELFIYQHNLDSFEVIMRSEKLEGSDVPSCINRFLNEITNLINNTENLESLETEKLFELLDKIRYINSRYSLDFKSDHLNDLISERINQKLGISNREPIKQINTSDDLEKLLGIKVVFNTQQAVPSDLNIV